MSAAEKALDAVEADTKAMGNEAREIAAYNGDSHLLEVLPSVALRRERYTLALAAVARAASVVNAHFPPSGVTYINSAFDADIKRLRAALDALEAATQSTNKKDRHEAAQPAAESEE